MPTKTKVKAQTAPIQISILGPIGAEGATAETVKAQLDQSPTAPVTVTINSDGGDLVEGLAIYSVLRSHKGPVTTENIALAASAASIVFMAGEKRIMYQGAALMVHGSSRAVQGNATDLRKAAESLDVFDQSMVVVYADRTGMEPAKVEAQLREETWLGAPEAVEQGYATELGSSMAVAAKATRPVPPRFLFIGRSERMDLRTKLGLPAEATDEQVQEALDQLLAKQVEQTSTQISQAAEGPDIAALVQKAVSDAFAAREAAAAATTPAVSQQELHAAACNAAVERFIAEGKIPPANRDAAIKACGSTSASLSACVAYWESAPRIVATAQRFTAPATGSLSPVQKMIAAKAGMSEADFIAAYNKGTH